MNDFLITLIILLVVAVVSFFLGAYWKKNKTLKKANEIIKESEAKDNGRDDELEKAQAQLEENNSKLEEKEEKTAKETLEKAKEIIKEAKEELKKMKGNN